IGVATTALPPRVEGDPLSFSISYFRPTRAQPGNLLARRPVVNTSSFFSFPQVGIEDPQGRQLAHAASQFAIRLVDPPRPPPPSEVRPFEAPTYTTPEPSLRPVPSAILPRETSERSDGLTEVRVMLDRASPYQELHGHLLAEVEEGRVVGTI